MTFKTPIHFLTYYSAGYKLPRDPLLSKTTSSVITKYFCNVMFPSFSRFSQSRHFLIHPHHEPEPEPLTYHSKESRSCYSHVVSKIVVRPKNQNAFSAQPPRCLHVLYLRLPRYCQYSLEIKVMSHLASILL